MLLNHLRKVMGRGDWRVCGHLMLIGIILPPAPILSRMLRRHYVIEGEVFTTDDKGVSQISYADYGMPWLILRQVIITIKRVYQLDGKKFALNFAIFYLRRKKYLCYTKDNLLYIGSA